MWLLCEEADCIFSISHIYKILVNKEWSATLVIVYSILQLTSIVKLICIVLVRYSSVGKCNPEENGRDAVV